MNRYLLVMIAGLGLFALTSCNNGPGATCDAAIQCEGGNDKDVNACVAIANGAEQVAIAYDCLDAFNKLTDCRNTTGNCNNKHYVVNCNNENMALTNCQKGASGQ